ncbi:MAG: AAA family ATPase [Gemmatimonadota bacterium]|nr:AAA family ATPase [Gemmatimonadota bacterium]
MIYLRALGGLSLLDDRGRNIHLRSKKHLALLVYLASGARRTYDRSHLARLFWTTAEAQARHSLSQAVYDLTQRLGPIVSRGPGTIITLNATCLRSDVLQLEAALKAGNLTEAVDLYQGPFAEELVAAGTDEFDRWLDAERTRISRLGELALRRFVATCESQADWGKMCVAALRLTALAPLDEAIHRAFMRGLWLQGDGASALRHYESCVSALQAELPGGVSEETKALLEKIREDPRPSALFSEKDFELPLIGRAREFGLLREAVACIGASASSSVIVTGETGIGKTRLLEELIRSLRIEPLYVLESCCYQVEADEPYGSVLDSLRALLADNEATAAELVPHMRNVGQLLLCAADDDEIPNNDLTSAGRQRRLHDEVVVLLQAASKKQPVVWCIDDVQWIDRSSEGLVHYVSRRMVGYRFLFILTVRTPVGERLPCSNQRLPVSRHVTISEVHLTPLTETQIREILTQVEPEARDHPAMSLAVRLSSGNPSYALEVLRAAASSKEWARSAVQWDPINHVQLRRVLAVRLEGLSSKEIRVLRSVAVLGRLARPSLVAQLAGLSLAETAHVAEEVYRRRLIGDENNRLTFVNDAVREYVVSQMSGLEHAAFHLSAGNELEREGGVSAGALATHFYKGDDWARAFGYAMEAATVARDSGGNAEAAHFAGIAASAATGSDERRAALMARGDALFAEGHPNAAAVSYSEILSTTLPPTIPEVVTVFLNLGAAHIEACNWPAAGDVLAKAESRLALLESSSAHLRLRAEHASMMLKLALRTADQASLEAQGCILKRLISDLGQVASPRAETALSILMAAAVHESLTGSGDRATTHLVAAQGHAASVPQADRLRYLSLRGIVRTRQALWDAAEADFLEAHRLGAKSGDQVALIRIWNNLACVSLGSGEWAMVEQRLSEAGAIQTGMPEETDMSIPVALNRANMLFYQGFLSEAAAAYTQAEVLCRNQRSPEYLPEVMSCRGLVALQRGIRHSAEEVWQELQVDRSSVGALGSQERFKLEWFAAAMQRPLDGRRLLNAANDEKERDVPSYLKLLMIEAVIMQRGEAHISGVRRSLKEAHMGWFYHFIRRWHRMSALH